MRLMRRWSLERRVQAKEQWTPERRERQSQTIREARERSRQIALESAVMMRRIAQVSDVHTLSVTIGRLEQDNANPLLIEALNDLLGRIIAALNEDPEESQENKI